MKFEQLNFFKKLIKDDNPEKKEKVSDEADLANPTSTTNPADTDGAANQINAINNSTSVNDKTAEAISSIPNIQNTQTTEKDHKFNCETCFDIPGGCTQCGFGRKKKR